MSELLQDLRAALLAGLTEWHRCRWLRRHGNPDRCPF